MVASNPNQHVTELAFFVSGVSNLFAQSANKNTLPRYRCFQFRFTWSNAIKFVVQILQVLALVFTLTAPLFKSDARLSDSILPVAAGLSLTQVVVVPNRQRCGSFRRQSINGGGFGTSKSVGTASVFSLQQDIALVF